MKRISKFISVSILAFAAISCNFLDENMNTHYSAADIYGTEAALETAVTGCYQSFATSGFYGGAMLEWLSPASAIVHWGLTGTTLTDAQKRWLDLLSLNQFSKNPYNMNMFKSLYGTIYKCNKLIASLPDSPVEQSFKDEIEAEARFIRAESYFHIVRRWGNAPVHLEPETTIDQTNGKREDFWKLYGIVLEDLDYVYAHGRDYEKQLRYGIGTGRICKEAGRAVQSLVYLTIGTLLEHSDPNDNFWVIPNEEVFAGFKSIGIETARNAFEKALAAAKDVMPETSAKGSPYRLADNYYQLFRYTDYEDFRLRERIFVITSTNEQANYSQLATWTLPNGYNNTPDNMFYGRFRPSRFLFQKWCETYGGELGTGKAADIFVNCPDPRMDASLVYNQFVGLNGDARYCYPNVNCILNNSRWEGMPYFKKYYDPKYENTAGYADLYVMRLAEVYLIAAEACANLCSTPGDAYGTEGMGYVNILMKRARNSSSDGTPSTEPADWTASSIGTKENFIDRIFWERAFEMTGEEHEYFDTHRMGAKWFAEHVTIPANEFLFRPEQDDYNGGATEGHRKTFYGTAVKFGEGNIYPVTQADVRKGLLCAFPNDELVYNASLTLQDQNPEAVFWE